MRINLIMNHWTFVYFISQWFFLSSMSEKLTLTKYQKLTLKTTNIDTFLDQYGWFSPNGENVNFGILSKLTFHSLMKEKPLGNKVNKCRYGSIILKTVLWAHFSITHAASSDFLKNPHFGTG